MHDAPRILLAVSRLQRGGLEQVLLDVATGLTRRGFAFEVVALCGPGARDDDFRQSGVPVRVLSGRASLAAPAANSACLLQLAREIRRFRPDVLQTHHFFSGVLGRLAGLACNVPVLIQSDHNFYLWKGWLARTADRALSPVTDLFVVPSEAVARHVAGTHAVPARRVVVVPNGRAVPRLLSRRQARERLGLPLDGSSVGFVGRLVPSKRPEDFVRVAARMARPDTSFAILGSGPLEARCRELAAGLPVRFAGEIACAAELMNAFDVLVGCSAEEGFGLAASEAVMAEVPVVLTDLPAFRELLPAHGFVPVGDTDALARAVSAVLDDHPAAADRARLDRRSLEARLSSEAMVDGYERLYRRALHPEREAALSSSRSSFTGST